MKRPDKRAWVVAPPALFAGLSLSGLDLSPTSIDLFNQNRIYQLLATFWLVALVSCHKNIRLHAWDLLRNLSPKVKILLALFWLLGFLSALQSDFPRDALLDWAHYGLLFISTLAVTGLYLAFRRSALIVLLAGVSTGATIAIYIFVLDALLSRATGNIWGFTWWWLPYTNPRFISHALTWTLPVAVGLAVLIPQQKRGLRTSAFVLVSLYAAMLFWSGSRGAIAGVGAGIAAVAVLMPTARQAGLNVLRGLLAGVLAWAAIYLILPDPQAAAAGSNSALRFTSSGREHLLATSLQMIEKFPWLGAGPNHFSIYNAGLAAEWTGSAPAHPHNVLLQITAEWGIPAALCLCFLTFFAACGVFKRRKPNPEVLSKTLFPYLLIATVSASAQSMVCGVFVMPLSQILGVIVLGLLWGIHQEQPPPSPVNTATKKSGFLALASFGLVLVTTYGLTRSWPCLVFPQQVKGVKLTCVEYPRFWIQGRIPYDHECVETGRYVAGQDRLSGDRPRPHTP